MSRILVAYFSLTGNTEMMAQYIAEGIRMSGQEAVVKKLTDIKSHEDLAGYDGYIFGSPTFHQDIAEPMKTFLFMAKKADLEGKLAGAFGSYSHDGNAPAKVFDTMQYVFKMKPFELGAFNLKEDMLQSPGRGEADNPRYVAGEVHSGTGEGMRSCQDYGRVFGEKVAS
jgi:flavodoxin